MQLTSRRRDGVPLLLNFAFMREGALNYMYYIFVAMQPLNGVQRLSNAGRIRYAHEGARTRFEDSCLHWARIVLMVITQDLYIIKG